MYKNVENLILEDAIIIFRNFSGKASKYNRLGDRNFGVIINDPNLAQQLNEEGWNVKILRPRDEQDEPDHYIPVSVNYNNRPPKIYIITHKGKTLLDEETVASLDYAEIKRVDLTLNPYFWERDSNSGIKAYLKTMYVTIEEDPFESKYE